MALAHEKAVLDAATIYLMTNRELEALSRSCRELMIVVKCKDSYSGVSQGESSSKRQGLTGSDARSATSERSVRQIWNDMRRVLRLSSTSSHVDHSEAARPPSQDQPGPPTDYDAQAQRALRVSLMNDWTTVLRYFRVIDTLTITVRSCESLSPNNHIEDTLVAIRVALETSSLPYLKRFRFQPVHAVGVLAFRWLGFGAMMKAPASAHSVWERITHLDLQVRNPFLDMSTNRKLVLLKLLHSYIASFAPTICRLRFIWLDGNGPSPMALLSEPGMVGTSGHLSWPRLEELWLGNINSLGRAVAQAQECAPGLQHMRVLRAQMRDNAKVFEEAGAWVTIVLNARTTAVNVSPACTSSIYESMNDQFRAGSETT